MNIKEYLLSKLAEECAEVIQRCEKAKRFGLEEVQVGQYLNNQERLEKELIDLFAAIEMLQDYHLLDKHFAEGRLIGEKKTQTEIYMKYSRRLGTLE